MFVLFCFLPHSEYMSMDALGLVMSAEVSGNFCLVFSWHKSLNSHCPLIYLAPAPLRHLFHLRVAHLLFPLWLLSLMVHFRSFIILAKMNILLYQLASQ